MRIVVALVVWAAALAGAAEVSSVVAHQARNERAAASFDASAVTAAEPQSLFHTAKFAQALAVVRTHFGANARVNRFVLYPGYLSATVVTGPTTTTDVYVNAAGKYEPSDGGSPDSSPTFPLARVPASAPAALAQRIATTGGVPESQLHYMIAERELISHRFHWLVYPVDGGPVTYFETSGPTGRLFEYRTNSTTGLQPVGSG
jgi:hypothetical protein